jgi:hypothetical protein
MKSKILLLSLLAALWGSRVHALPTIQQDLNLSHVGDVIVKHQLSPVMEGDKGANILWDFRDAEVVREDYGILNLPPLQLESGWYLMIDKDTVASKENIIIRHDYPQRTNYFNLVNLRSNTYYVLDFWLDGYLVQGQTVLKK